MPTYTITRLDRQAACDTREPNTRALLGMLQIEWTHNGEAAAAELAHQMIACPWAFNLMTHIPSRIEFTRIVHAIFPQ